MPGMELARGGRLSSPTFLVALSDEGTAQGTSYCNGDKGHPPTAQGAQARFKPH